MALQPLEFATREEHLYHRQQPHGDAAPRETSFSTKAMIAVVFSEVKSMRRRYTIININ
jgi:hypothetical protein